MGLVVGFVSFIVFLFFQAQGIFAGDSGDLVTAAIEFGVPHPPGYPLYTFAGYLFSQLSVLTPSWRVTLVSSIPHAVTVALIYSIVHLLTKSRLSAVFAGLTLLGNYLFFLYSVTPEVFALLDMFLALLLYELLLYKNNPTLSILIVMALTFGLSLTHHHVILFVLPVLLFSIVSFGLPKKIGVRDAAILLFFFLLGFSVYMYVPIAGSTTAIINWDKPTTVARFIQLVTRQDYGSFLSGGVIGKSLIERFISMKAYFSFIVLDFRVIGIVLSFVGLFVLWMRERVLCKTVLLLLFILGPFFFFYASFPIVGRFTLGTYERFLLPSYCIYALILGIGFDEVVRVVTAFGKKRWSGSSLFGIVFSVILFLYPVTMASITLYRFMGLSSDKTAENLGNDVLGSVPQDAILLLSQDTLLFITQYVRYGMRVRPDTIVLHASRMTSEDYNEVVKNRFSNLVLPDIHSQTYLGDFIKANKKDHRIFSNTILGVGTGWYFIPHGLLYEIVAFEELPPVSLLQEVNSELFASYKDPLTGILSRYKHLMLSDVLDVYAWAHINYGKTLVKATAYEKAIVEFSQAVFLDGNSSRKDAYTYLGATYAVTGRCNEALEAFSKAKDASFTVQPEQLLYESLTYRDCVKDATKANTLFSEYEKLKTSLDTPLQSL